MKHCFKCGETRPLTDFYRHPAMADGHLGKCKACTKSDVALRYQNKRLEIRKYEQNRSQDPDRKQKMTEWQRAYRSRNPIKNRARAIVQRAVRTGKLVPQPCAVCGERAQAHHEDHSKPLAVEWLCFKHHREEHGQVMSV